MAVGSKDFDRNIENAVKTALNGGESPFSKIALAERESAMKEVISQDEIRRSNDSKYTPMTAAQITNAANDRASRLSVEKIKDGLRTAEVAGNDQSNMIEFALGMAFGGGGSMMSMVMNVIKGESPFFKTVRDSFKDGKVDLASFSDRWKDNVQSAAITKYAKENGISPNELIATLSNSGVDVQLAKVLETSPIPSAEEKAKKGTKTSTSITDAQGGLKGIASEVAHADRGADKTPPTNAAIIGNATSQSL